MASTENSAVRPTDPLASGKQGVVFENTMLPDVIELRDVSQSYDGGNTWIIKNCNLLIEDTPDQGQFVVVLGPSGCGKSTLLRYIAGLQQPTSGVVLLNEKVRSSEAVAMVFQQYSSLPWLTVLENVMLPLRLQYEHHHWRPSFLGLPKAVRQEIETKARAMLANVGLTGHEHKFAQYPILSGGQLQRVAIARSLICNPDVILMDEPFGALDTKTRFDMQVMLAGIWEKLQSTIILVTHDVQEAVFLADDIFVMSANPGMIVEKIHIGLPFHRDRTTKRTVEFQNYVAQVEDAVTAVAAMAKK